MGYEVDFLPVGDEARGGDAIALRFGNLTGPRNEQIILVIDGGTKDSGSNIVEHVKKYYNNADSIDLIIATHLHADHISGLTVVLENMNVKQLWMHKPWEHAQNIKDMFSSGRITNKSLKENLKKSLEQLYELPGTCKKEKYYYWRTVF